MCLDCFLKQSRRHFSSAVRSTVSTRSRTSQMKRTGATQFSFQPSRLLVRNTKSKDNLGRPTQPKSHVRTFTTSPTSLELDSFIRRDNLKKPSGNIRALLKKWQPDLPAQPIPLEPSEAGRSGLGDVNNLTRPETLDTFTEKDNFVPDEYAQSYVKDFDRITDATVGGGHLGSMLKRGDLVELRATTNAPLLAVYLGISENRFFQFYTISGKLYSAGYRSAAFQVDGYFDPTELDPIMPYIPRVTEDTDMDVTIPRNISAPILHKIVRFRMESEDMYRRYSAAIDGVYDRVALPKDLRFMLLEDIVSEVIGQPVDEQKPFPPQLLFAVSNALIRERFGFVAEMRSYAETHVLCVQPKENATIIERVQRWLRAYHEEAALVAGGFEVPRTVVNEALFVKAFVRKCSKLVAESRALRQYSPEGLVLCCRPKDLSQFKDRRLPFINSLEFSDSDRHFIRVLKLHTMGTSLFQHATYRSLSSAIVRAVGAYADSELREDMCWNFLVELGVVEPYAHSQGFDSRVWPSNQKLAHELEEVEQVLIEGKTVTEAVDLQDSMQHLRHDWGDLPVYCIDSEDTQEIDDGISLERIPDEPDTFWLHVHVAHISAFTTRDNLLGRCAEHRLSSLYLPDERLKMLPEWASLEYSLGPDRPCLTYSIKLTRNGETLGNKVQAGIVRNVFYMTPGSVNDALGVSSAEITEKPPHLTIQCGKESKKRDKRSSRSLFTPSDDHKKDLKDLVEICRRVRDQRVVSSPIGQFFAQDLLECRVSNVKNDVRITTTDNPIEARFNLLDPYIELKINHDAGLSSSGIVEYKGRARDNADMMVEQAMLLANVTAGKWAKDRDIPIIYTGTRPAVADLEPITALARRGLLHGNWDDNFILHTLLTLYAVRVFTSYPVEQKIMGTPEYAKVTSPLRRFLDLVSSWQIDAALRHEHETGKSLANRTDSDNPTDFLPYQRAEIEKNLRIWVSRSQSLQTFQNSATSHWVVQGIGRAFYLGEASLPSPLTCDIGRITAKQVYGKVRELEYNVVLEAVAGPDGTPVKVGDVWEVEILKIMPYVRQIMVNLVRRLAEGHGMGSQVVHRTH